MTVEDPIEYDIAGIDQVEINPKAGLTFATGLRSILRHDPDIVMVGEIRDKETASIALQAGMTGHLVFSTLHTNDAPSAISRLIDLGGEPFIISNALACVIGQRLVRKICLKCKERDPMGAKILKRTRLDLEDLHEEATFWKGRGCEACQYTGYSGRIGIFEIVPVTPALAELIASEASSVALKKTAEQEGFQTMAFDGIRKALEGITTIDEVFRVAPPEVEHISEILSAAPVVDEEGSMGESEPEAEQFSIRGVRPKKILVADDDDIFCRVIETILETENYQVITAANGKEALKLAVEEKPDLVVADLRMPEMDGLTLVKRLKSQLSTRFIPTIMITVKDDLDSEVRGLESGVDDYLTKPIQPERLLARVKRFLNREEHGS
jgi:type IV pilus assembly protein PilB